MGLACSTCCITKVSHKVQLPEQLETGDLILFRTNTIAARVTRWCTDAPFDHVAMVLRTAEGFRTVECTGQGIGCWQLQERLDDYIIKGAVIRRLRTALTNDMVRELNTFLQSVKHKPYRLNQTILRRMLRTCLCCQREGQHTHEAAEAERERARSKGKLGKYAAPSLTEEERKEQERQEAEPHPSAHPSPNMEDGEVPIPELLPPQHDAAHEPVRPMSPSECGPSPRVPRSSAAAGASSAAATSAAAHSAAASSTPAPSAEFASASPPAAATSTAPLAHPPAGMDLRSPKALLELRDHEHLRLHYPEPEDVDSLHLKNGFFCSSFIAACYMRMGLLPAWPPIDWYLPATFSSQTAIQAPLLLGAEFAEECLIEKPSRDSNPRKWSRVQKEAVQQQKRDKERREREKEVRKLEAAAAAATAAAVRAVDMHVVDFDSEALPSPLHSPSGMIHSSSPAAVATGHAAGSAAAGTAPSAGTEARASSIPASAQQLTVPPSTAGGTPAGVGMVRRTASYSISSSSPSDHAPVRRSPNFGPQGITVLPSFEHRNSLSRNRSRSVTNGQQPASNTTTASLGVTIPTGSMSPSPKRTPSPGPSASATVSAGAVASATTSSHAVSGGPRAEVVPTVMRTKSVLRHMPLSPTAGAAAEQQQQQQANQLFGMPPRPSDSPRSKPTRVQDLASPSGNSSGGAGVDGRIDSPMATGVTSASSPPPLLRAGSKVARLPPLQHYPSKKLLGAGSDSDSDSD